MSPYWALQAFGNHIQWNNQRSIANTDQKTINNGKC